ncbi:MAG: acetoacetyl-CoA synthetase [Paraburkholderia sp.]|nr:acetoacetyl-CoA synthetase [Paraburkholderia sp.]
MTEFTAELQDYTGKVFNNYEALHNFSVRECRTFWQYFVQWSPGLSGPGISCLSALEMSASMHASFLTSN